jgi:hypothetical protein
MIILRIREPDRETMQCRLGIPPEDTEQHTENFNLQQHYCDYSISCII